MTDIQQGALLASAQQQHQVCASNGRCHRHHHHPTLPLPHPAHTNVTITKDIMTTKHTMAMFPAHT